MGQVPASHADVTGTKLQPTRAAPSPPVEVSHKAPQRPPPPSRDTAAGNHYEQIALQGPTGALQSPTVQPPPPPDSRHRFYSTQLPRRPVDSTPAVSVSTMRSKFELEPARSVSPVVAARHTKPDVKSSSAVPDAVLRPPQHLTAKPSSTVNESQC